MNTSKIIKGAVSNGRYTVTAPIVKEDYGLYLQIEGVELPSTYEVDFSNDEHHGTSVTMIGNSDGVLIPSQFISSGKDVFAFLYHVGEDFGRTVYKFRIPNKLRPDRTNIAPTPEEQSVIDQAISALNEAVAQTAQDVIDADASAQSASADAERAEEARTDAQNYATQAEEHSHDAESSSISASASARASAQSAQSASQSAQTAQDALEEFTTPTASATTLPEGSNATATYADGHFSFGIPRGDKGERGEQGIQGERGERGLQGERGEKGEQGDDYVLTEQDKQDIADIAEADLTPTILNAFPTDTASGAVASFSDGADNLPLKSLVVNIDPVQDLSQGDPSPENICPISGWEQMQLNANGTVIPISWQTEAGTVYGGKLDVLSGVLTVEYQCIKIKDASNFSKPGDAFRIEVDRKADTVYPRSDTYKTVAPSASTVAEYCITCHRYGIYSNNYRKIIYINDPRYATVEEFVEAMGEHQILFELNTPLEIQLTPHEVNSLLGVNNIFADTGDTEVEYRANTELWVQRKITEAVASLT